MHSKSVSKLGCIIFGFLLLSSILWSANFDSRIAEERISNPHNLKFLIISTFAKLIDSAKISFIPFISTNITNTDDNVAHVFINFAADNSEQIPVALTMRSSISLISTLGNIHISKIKSITGSYLVRQKNNEKINRFLNKGFKLASEFELDPAQNGIFPTIDTIRFFPLLEKVRSPAPDPKIFRSSKNADLVINALVAEAPSDCTNLNGVQWMICEFNKVAGVVALVIALCTLLLVIIVGLVFNRNLHVTRVSKQVPMGDWDRVTGVAKEKPSAYLTVLTDQYRQTLGDNIEIYRKTETTIGRNPITNKIVIQDIRHEPEVSKEHVIIRFESSDKRWYIKDVASTNGTKVNSVHLQSFTEEILDDGAEIILGRLAYGGVKFQFNIVYSDNSYTDDIFTDDTYVSEDENRITH